MSALYFDARIDGEKLAKDIASIDAQLKSMTSNFQTEGDKWDVTMRKIGAGMAAYFSIDYLSSFAKEMVNVRGEFQKFEAVLTNTLDGDKVRASGLLEGLADFAAKTPFQLNDITENFVKLANQGIILAQEELVKLGDFAAVTGKPIGQLFEAILDINNPERWKEFGARIQTEGEKVMISFRGQKIEFDRTIEGAKNAIAQLGSMDGVAGTMSVISETLIGQISNLQDAWDQMLNNLGKANEGTFSGLLSGATSLIENYKTVLDVLKTLVYTFGAAKAAAIIYNIVLKEQAAINAMVAASNGVFNRSLAMQFLWTERAQKAQSLLNKTMLTNPYVLAAAGITALVSGLVILNRKFEESIDVKRRYDEQTKVLNEGYQSRIDSANQLITTLKNESEAEAKRLEAFEELQRLYPTIFGNMDLHIAKTKDLAVETKALAEEENKRTIAQQKAYIASLIKQKSELETILEDKTQTKPQGNSLLFYNPDPQAQAKLKAVNDQIRQENDRLNEMVIEQIDAQKQLQQESEKTIQQRIKEADSIEKLGRLREEWDKKWKTATTVDNRSKIESELAIIDAALKKMKGDGRTKTDIKEEEDRLKALEQLAKQEIDLKQRIESSKVALMKEGREKQLAEIELSYQNEIDSIQNLADERLKAMNESLPENKKVTDLPQNEQALFDELRVQAEAKRSKEIQAVNEEAAARIKEIWRKASEFFLTQKELEIQAVIDNYDLLLKEAKDFGDAELEAKLQEAKNAEIDKINRDYAMSRIESEKQINDSLLQLAQSEVLFNKRKYLQLLNQAKAYELERLKIAKSDPKKSETDIKEIESNIKVIESAITNFKNASAQELVSVITDVTGFLGEYNEIFKGISSISSGVGKVMAGDLTGILEAFKGITQLFDLQGKKEEERYKAMVEAMNSYIDNIDLQFEMIGRSIERAFGEDKLNGFRKGIQAIGKDLTWAITEINRLAKVTLALPDKDAIIGYSGPSTSGAGNTRPGGQPIFGYSIEGIEKAISENEKRINKLTLEYEKTGDDRVKQVLDAYQKWVGELYNLKDTYMELLTGTTPGGIADAIVQGFQQGKRSAQDFADDFEEMIKQALISAMKIRILEAPLTDFYAQFADAMDDGILTKEERIDLRETYDRIIDLAKQWGDGIEETLGFNPFGTETQQQKGMAGQIKGITEETGSMIAGQFYAMRELDQKVYELMASNFPTHTDLLGYNREIADIQQKTYMNGIEQLDALNQSVTHLAEIAANTRDIKELYGISQKLTDMNNYLKAVV